MTLLKISLEKFKNLYSSKHMISELIDSINIISKQIVPNANIKVR